VTQASENGDAPAIQRISQELAKLKRQVEEKVSQWEAAQAEMESAEKSYEERLARVVQETA
jgi:molecular chaperone GrpE (heat shock protein)